jgi:ABC-type bacteriocin/lantibiotic exporter with double-glycine peptidase domain
VDLGSQLQEAQGNLNKLDDVLRAPPDPQLAAAPPRSGDAAAAGAPAKLSGQFERRDVTFGYNPLAPPLIEGFNLTVGPGQRVALVGTSGSGKSTLANLICGLFQPWSGQVLLDDQPRDRVPRDVLAASLAHVDQQLFLFEGSVADNLTLWNPTISEATMVQAAKDACIHDEVTARPDGYASPVEEGGRNFSGGQAQRLEIARALVGNPTLLVLDEARPATGWTSEAPASRGSRSSGATGPWASASPVWAACPCSTMRRSARTSRSRSPPPRSSGWGRSTISAATISAWPISSSRRASGSGAPS